MLFETTKQNLILRVHLLDDNDLPITGVLYSSGSLQISYLLESSGAWVSPALVDGVLGSYNANSWKEVGNGVYQYCPPNGALVTGTTTLLRVTYGANRPQYDTLEPRLIQMAASTGVGGVAVLQLTPATIVGFPVTMNIGDTYSVAMSSSIQVFIRNGAGTPLTGIGTHLFTDGDFRPTIVVTQDRLNSRVTGTLTYVVPGGGAENYLRVEFPSHQTRRASAGWATMQLVAKWGTDEVTLATQAVEWIDRI